MIRTLRAAVVLLAAACVPRVATATDTVPSSAGSFDEAFARLGAAPTADAVRALARSHEVGSSRDLGLRLVALLQRRGRTPTLGLAALAGHDDPAVREVALRAISTVGLRVAGARQEIRAALKDADRSVRRAALEALGRVGDADDMPAFLATMTSDEKALAESARRAIVALTGLPPVTRPAEIETWWAEGKGAARERLASALGTLVVATGSADARNEISRLAWLDIGKVESVVRSCVRSSDARLRADGFHLAAALRLGDLADEVAGASKYEMESDLAPLAKAAAVELGVGETPGVRVARPERARAMPMSDAVAARAQEPGERTGEGAAAVAPVAAAAAAPAVVDLGLGRPLDERLHQALQHMEARRLGPARTALDAVTATGDEPSRTAARKGYAALYWLGRLQGADAAVATALKDEARRNLRYSLWAPLFS